MKQQLPNPINPELSTLYSGSPKPPIPRFDRKFSLSLSLSLSLLYPVSISLTRPLPYQPCEPWDASVLLVSLHPSISSPSTQCHSAVCCCAFFSLYDVLFYVLLALVVAVLLDTKFALGLLIR
ncbi:hypothetical protein VNO77_17737 [Canavalia gladiata]|uniref:Uncharacterized protein n=1 Tax=Canavalia gladiata TaxID=3824 RepID=A0AAN9QGX6_CANGL